jgi:putative protease
LAPAGDPEVLAAALDAGADAVYFGLERLNARRRASNFSPDAFVQAVGAAHRRGARAYLTLNIDLGEREVGEAARILELARACGADAVLVRDPALLALRPAYPGLEFHFSTQACVANSADVRAAAALGVQRVVLARELSRDEVAAASCVPGVATEAFVQGALCFSVSGRCLLSSWVGGRSGNRGACTSPCRVPWSLEGEPAGTPWSMRDLALWDRLAELRQAGVAAFKIEGRLKNAAWVRRAVSLYRAALRGEDAQTLAAAAATLGDYTGRGLTSGYFDGQRGELTGASGRKTSIGEPEAAAPAETTEDAGPVYDLDITVGEKTLDCRCSYDGRSGEWSLPRPIVRRLERAVSLAEAVRRLAAGQVQGLSLRQVRVSEPTCILPPRTVNALQDRLSAALRLLRKPPDNRVRITLPEPVRRLLAEAAISPDNRLHLGQAPDRVRLDAGQLPAMRGLCPPGGAVVEGLAPGLLESAVRFGPVTVALPSVFFEADLVWIRELLSGCKRMGLGVEVNSWGGWQLAQAAGVAMEAGPGLAVLNSLAAKKLASLGLASVTLALEADRQQLEDISEHCPVACSVVVFGRPPLFVTRVELSADRFADKTLTDRRGVSLRPQQENGLWVFRPVEPFDWRGLRNENIRARHLVMDLIGSPEPGAEFARPAAAPARLFNYGRSLA